MATFSLSPAVTTIEQDLSTTIGQVATSITGTVGYFHWGPVSARTLVTQERDLIDAFAKPDDLNYKDWFVAEQFLRYGNILYIVRVVDDTTPGTTIGNGGLAIVDSTTATGGTSAYLTTILNEDDTPSPAISFGANDKVQFVSRYPSDESLTVVPKIKVAVANTTDFATANIVTGTTFISQFDYAPDTDIFLTLDDVSAFSVAGDISGDSVGGNDGVGTITAISGNIVTVTVASGAFISGNGVDNAASYSADETDIASVDSEYAICVLVNDEIVERHIVSTLPTAKNDAQESIYVDDWTANRSAWIWGFDNTAVNLEPDSITATLLTGGKADAPLAGDIQAGYDLYGNAEEVDINILIDGANNDAVTQAYIADNIVDVRKDCVAIFSPPSADVVGVASDSTRVTNLTTYKKTTLAKVSSYCQLYDNWKLMYDKHNDKKRWIPCSGDIAGVHVFTDETRDAWFAPAGYNRGVIKNVIKLAWSANKPRRDLLYKDQVNSIVMDKDVGAPVILGGKNLLNRNSAFNRISVRRLFIVMEKAIATAAKFYLFEKNNEFTRTRFKGEIQPFLADIQGRDGIYDFSVICDTTNNTSFVIDANQFKCDIYVKPQRDAEEIILTFVAVGTGVDFGELVRKT